MVAVAKEYEVGFVTLEGINRACAVGNELAAVLEYVLADVFQLLRLFFVERQHCHRPLFLFIWLCFSELTELFKFVFNPLLFSLVAVLVVAATLDVFPVVVLLSEAAVIPLALTIHVFRTHCLSIVKLVGGDFCDIHMATVLKG